MKNKIIQFLKEKPKQAYFIMMLLCLVSTITSFTMYFSSKKKPKISNQIQFKFNSGEEIINTTGKIMELKEIEKELNIFLEKESLDQKDSLRIKYLLNKINDEKN